MRARITALLIWRFLIDLQAANQQVVKLDRNDPLYSSGDGGEYHHEQSAGRLSFARFDVVGSLGEQLSPGEHASLGTLTFLEGDSGSGAMERAEASIVKGDRSLTAASSVESGGESTTV